MGFLGLLALGVVLGAAGTEVLRAKSPAFVEKLEEAAKGLADRILPSNTTDAETKDK